MAGETEAGTQPGIDSSHPQTLDMSSLGLAGAPYMTVQSHEGAVVIVLGQKPAADTEASTALVLKLSAAYEDSIAALRQQVALLTAQVAESKQQCSQAFQVVEQPTELKEANAAIADLQKQLKGAKDDLTAAEQVCVKSHHNTFLGVRMDGTAQFYKDVCQRWTLRRVKKTGKHMLFRHTHTGEAIYLSAADSGQVTTTATCGETELFEIVVHGHELKVSLKTHDGRYIRAGAPFEGHTANYGRDPRPWEMFTLVKAV